MQCAQIIITSYLPLLHLGLLNHKQVGPTIFRSQGPTVLASVLCISETLKISVKYFDIYKNVANFPSSCVSPLVN